LKVKKNALSAASSQTQALQAYQLIEEMIVKGTLEPGAKVSEKVLSELIGLGRTPIREALQRLAAEGTVSIVPRAGVIISPIDITDQFRLIEVRRELEKMLAGRAARLVTLDERDRFRALAARFRAAGDADDAEQFIPTDREFNALVAETAHNKYALMAMSAIQAQTRRFWFLYFRRYGDLKKVCEFHACMAEAIASSDEAAARKASDDLIDYVEDYTRRTLDALCN
jgi:DNA-binding GntR family transcriptional regulator